jgi:hypothetical protein
MEIVVFSYLVTTLPAPVELLCGSHQQWGWCGKVASRAAPHCQVGFRLHSNAGPTSLEESQSFAVRQPVYSWYTDPSIVASVIPQFG